MASAITRGRSIVPVAFAVALVVAFTTVPVILAVEQTGDITGSVRDDKGQPLPGATVSLSGPNLQGERAIVTDAKGDFAFRALPPGTYTVKVSAPGYQVIEQEKVVVNIGRTTTLPFTPAAGALTETVSVTARIPLVDPIRTQTQDNYTPDYLEKVSIGSGGRDYLSVIQASAGVGPGDGGNPTVRGSTIGQNLYLVDGVDSTDPVTNTFGTNFIYDAIQEIQFQTGGFEAEFGRSTGGIVNVVTKSGGNTFSGSFDGRYRNENFIEKGDHFDPNDFDLTREIGEATLGGPIVKDKLWFFLAGSYVKSETATANSPSVFSFNGRYYLGKLTWQMNPQNKFILQATGDPATIDNIDASVLVAKEANSKQVQGSNFVTAQYIGNLSSNTIFQAQAATYRAELDFKPQDGDLSTIGWINFFTGAQYRNSLDAQFSDRFRNQLNATLTWNKNDWGGDHTFKFGADYQRIKFEFRQLTPGGEYDEVCFPSDGCPGSPSFLLYHVIHAAGKLTNKGVVGGYFAQDGWRIHPRLTLNVGLRYETFAYDDDTGHEVLSADLLQPRAGISWDMTGDSKNVVKAYAGRFGDPSLLALPRVVNSRANSEDLYVNENFFGDVNGDSVIEDRAFYATFGGPGGSVFAHGGNLKATSVVEFSTSYERQLTASSAVGLTLVRRKTYDIIEDRFDQRQGVYVIDNLNRARRKHYGAELRYRNQWKRWFIQASYAWGKSKGNLEYTQSLGTDFDFPALGTNTYGYLSDDVRNQVKLNGYVDLPWRFQVGYEYTWLTGYPYDQLRDAFPKAPYGTIFVEPRGSRRFPDLHQLNLDLRKNFPIGRTSVTAYLSVLNVFDTEIVVGLTERAGLEGQAIAYQTPRRYEIGGRFQF